MSIEEKITVYHGSYMIVEKPDISQCKTGKDFGQGFYVTTSRMQALSFAKTSTRKAIINGIVPKDTKFGYVSAFTLENLNNLKVYEFKDADSEWLHCVVAHRKTLGMKDEIAKWITYDVMYGKIANDNTNLVITAYMDGLYGPIGTEKADDIAIGFLEPENLKDQFCFRSVESMTKLTYIGNERVSI